MRTMDVVRYRAGEATRWLKVGGENTVREAVDRGRSLFSQRGMDQRNVTDNLKTAAGAVMDFGRGKIADHAHSRAESTEYVLQDDRMDIVQGNTIRSVLYSEIAGITMHDDYGVIVLEKGQIPIKPVAHLVSGRARVPVGWTRNGVEVAFDLLLEELAARAGVELG